MRRITDNVWLSYTIIQALFMLLKLIYPNTTDDNSVILFEIIEGVCISEYFEHVICVSVCVVRVCIWYMCKCMCSACMYLVYV